MSLKKATPKAVFEACQQLTASIDAEESGIGWNRDDVRLLVGGGSFAVIDPLIKVWRKLQPMREVAPSVPSELLVQVATMLEQQVSAYIADIEQRDAEREIVFNEGSEMLAGNLQQLEESLTGQLEVVQQSNHDLEAECARLESERAEQAQESLALQLKVEVLEEGLERAKQGLLDEKERGLALLQQQKQDSEQVQIRQAEQEQHQLEQVKLEHQQQLGQQKKQLTDAAEVAENRLMRLLDQGRSELKDVQLIAENKLEALRIELLEDKQLLNKQKLQLNQQEVRYQAQLAVLADEKAGLQERLQLQENLEQESEKSDLQELKDSIRLLQDQVSGK